MKIKRQIIELVIEHARRDAPLEACGYLAAKDGIITASYPLSNIDKSDEHFSFDPKEQFTVARDARSKGLDLCVVYHSHPHTPARPSDEDIKLAHDPALLYAIISLTGGKEDIKVFKINGQIAEQVGLEVISDDEI